MELLLGFLIFLNIIGIVLIKARLKNLKTLDLNISQKNEQLLKKNIALNEAIYQKEDKEKALIATINQLNLRISSITEDIKNLENKRFTMTEENLILQTSHRKNFEQYCDILDKEYVVKEKEYDSLILKLKESYDKIQKEQKDSYDAFLVTLSQEIKEEEEKLQSIKATRAASIAAQLKEEEIQKQKDFYCLPLSQADENEIQFLNEIKNRLKNPRLISMLIWTTFFQKNMTTLCNNILGTKTIIGIYKITNQCNHKCYIGQSVNVADRWKTHAKYGLGIDTPANNRLYSDMLKYGIWNFSWELLEECPKEKLNEKERFFIDLYQSNDYGYNMTKGNK